MSEPGTARPPDPSAVTSEAQFVELLRELRLWAGNPSLRRLRQLGGTTTDARGIEIDALPVSTTSHVLRGDRLPRVEFIRAFVTACLRARRQDPTGIGEVVERWHEGWLRLRQVAPDEPAAPARSTPTSVPRQLPLASADFTGRDDEVALLAKLLAPADRPDSVVILSIDGPGGVGKSALAIHAAHQLACDFPDGQLYVDLLGSTAGLTPLAPLDVLGRFLRALGVAGGDVPDEVDEAAAKFRTVVADRRLLLVLDNATDEAQMRPLLPGLPGCAVLVTSRSGLAGLAGVGELHLDVLSEQDAVTLLTRLVGSDRVAAEPAAAVDLARLCGFLPLALRIVGARLSSRPGWPIAALVDRLAGDPGLEVLRIANLGVRASFDFSYQQLRNSDDPADRTAAEAFVLLGVWDGPDVGLPVAAQLLDRPERNAEQALERLVDGRLLESPARGRYRLHDLLRRYAREHAERAYPEPVRATTLARPLRFYVATAWHTFELLRPGDRRMEQATESWRAGGARFADSEAALVWLETEQANLVAAVTQAAGLPTVAIAASQLAQALYGFFVIRGQWRDCVRVNTIAVEVALRTGDRTGLAQAHNDLGAAHHLRGRYHEALACHQKSLAIRREIGDRYGAAASLGNLGCAYWRLGRYDDAITCHRENLTISRELGDRRGEAISLDNLGIVYDLQGSHDQALACLEEGLSIRREVGDRHGEANGLNNLGGAYHRSSRLDDAEACLRRSLELSQEFGDRRVQADNLRVLGAVHHAQGRYREALGCFQQSLASLDGLGDDYYEAETLRDAGSTLLALGRIPEAKAHLHNALAIYERLGIPADGVRTLLAENC
jgi:tetratricopeptide (TPR) repeat protein